MTSVIDRERLAATFSTLCEISSPSRKEKNVADYLRQRFLDLGADEIFEDDSRVATGSNTGNLIIRFNGNGEGEGLFFSCHMDTVEPGENVTVVRTGDIFTSDGKTILGGDDKSGIAAIIEALTVIREKRLPHGLLEVVLTTCEEIGLLGAKSLDYSKISASYGYALDSTGIDTVITGAPAANKMKIEIHGAAAHAGLNPEQGINAIQVAAKGISRLQLGRIDSETTANIGIIEGGIATNIVPPLVTLKGEVRSHSQEKLASHTANMKATFQEVVDGWHNSSPMNVAKPVVTMEIVAEYPAMHLDRNSRVIRRLQAAQEKIGKKLRYIVAGGGSDANIMNGKGLPTAIIATGMDKVHTVDEQLNLNDLESLTELLLALAVSDEVALI